MLFGIKESGAKKLFEKVNNMLTFDCSVSASALKISDNDSFSGAENTLKNMLKKSLAEGNSFSFLQTEDKLKKVEKLLDKMILCPYNSKGNRNAGS